MTPRRIAISLALALVAGCGGDGGLGNIYLDDLASGAGDGAGAPADLAGAAMPDLATAPPDLAMGGLPKFSFFVASLRAMQRLSGSQAGFGGDLRFGEVGPGAGLRGAD